MKNLVTIFKNRVNYQFSSSDSEKSDFKISLLNDFTAECIRKEKLDFDESDSLTLVTVCSSKHGGLLDYPKIVTESVGFVTEKWDFCFNIVQEKSIRDDNNTPNGHVKNNDAIEVAREEENAGQLSIKDEFVATVTESATKLILHHASLTETLIKSGDIEKLAGVTGGLALVRNKLWHYNENMTGEDGTKQFSTLYRETVELVECLCEQMTLYYSNTLTTMVMMDTDSQDWEDEKCWHEGNAKCIHNYEVP